MNKVYADIVLPLSLPQLYTYSIPEALIEKATIGKRVIVQFGKKKLYTGIIRFIHCNTPTFKTIKEIIEVIDTLPVVSAKQFEFWEWMALYYMCSLGDVYKAAIPAGMRIESQTILYYNPEFTALESLSEKEEAIHKILSSKKKLTINKIQKELQLKNIIPVISSMLDKNVLIADEDLKKNYSPKTDIYIKLNEEYCNEEQLAKVFDKLKRSKKQLNILSQYVSLFNINNLSQSEIKKKDFIKNNKNSEAAVNSLIKKNIFIAYQKEVSRLDLTTNHKTIPISNLAKQQEEAFVRLKNIFSKKDTALLFGITSSGKTEIYIHLIHHYITQGKQVLYLLPEIALSTQIINRLKQVFGNSVGIYNSKYSDSFRIETWKNLTNTTSLNSYKIILGVRSAIFLPFTNLGLIIVDEEHEVSYKQSDFAPRYHARDAALMLARISNAKTLLGSATPSIETFYNTQIGKYGLVELTQRYGNLQLPEIITVDTRLAYHKKKMHSHFSQQLIDHINEALKNNEQVILFQNRRGFSPFVQCGNCLHVPKCKQCDVSLTYHKYQNQLICHYCGYTIEMPTQCPICNSSALTTKGFGTQKIEEEAKFFFPNTNTIRMDLDTTKTKTSLEKIITDIETNKVSMVVGTQMITKGLNFDNVNLVAILNADNMLNYPDFRSHERAFQLMAQVSGRAGRKNKQGKVIIQTSMLQHPVIRNVVANNYIEFYKQQINDRKTFCYPPFYRLILITLKHPKNQVLDDAAWELTKKLRTYFNDFVLGPQTPEISKIQKWHLKNIILKINKNLPIIQVRQNIRQAINTITSQHKNLIITIDVDPY